MVNFMKRKTGKQTNKKKVSPRLQSAFHLEKFWMVGVVRRFQGKDGSPPGVRKARLEFRKVGVMKRPWVPERRKSSSKQALGNTHTVLLSPCSIGSSVCPGKWATF